MTDLEALRDRFIYTGNQRSVGHPGRLIPRNLRIYADLLATTCTTRTALSRITRRGWCIRRVVAGCTTRSADTVQTYDTKRLKGGRVRRVTAASSYASDPGQSCSHHACKL